jgi:hypothetical protein
MDKCAKCGSADGDKVRGNTISLRPCVCFALVFCGDSCLQAHEHSRLNDEAHFQPSIDVNFRRTFHRGQYPELLLKFTDNLVEYVKSMWATNKVTPEMQERFYNAPYAFDAVVAKKERASLHRAIKDYLDGLVQITTTGSIDRVLLDTPSKTLIRIWKSENKLTLQRSSVDTAWTTYTSAIIKFFEDVIGSSGNFSSVAVMSDISDLRRLSDAVGRVLNGSRWKREEDSTYGSIDAHVGEYTRYRPLFSKFMTEDMYETLKENATNDQRMTKNLDVGQAFIMLGPGGWEMGQESTSIVVISRTDEGRIAKATYRIVKRDSGYFLYDTLNKSDYRSLAEVEEGFTDAGYIVV